ncbi:hypothetical protein, conserved [Plasmodium gonderi]|uniref:PPM-type phosphatase domain-containing protein n=1 Tax=Plasmodium gonderi TaxID=77519 RepID=A0A1Y1JP89_PLAGO|nr:hypothetical protein, conserved [Plasmodium gonderi]GAW81864.1 hypothetical protein, conserved [Plasmodium gonderi]
MHPKFPEIERDDVINEFIECFDILLRKTDIKNVQISRGRSRQNVSINFIKDDQKCKNSVNGYVKRVEIKKHGISSGGCYCLIRRKATKLRKFLTHKDYRRDRRTNRNMNEIHSDIKHGFPISCCYTRENNIKKKSVDVENERNNRSLRHYKKFNESGENKCKCFKGAQINDLNQWHMNNCNEEIKNCQNEQFPVTRSNKIVDSLINNIQNYANYEYVVCRKKCYDCFMSLNKKCKSKNFDKYVSINQYFKRNTSNNNENVKKSFIFNYGFYAKKGKFHNNEDTSSHASFSSYKIRKEIEKIINHIRRNNIKYNLFNEILKKFHIDSHIIQSKKNRCNSNSSPHETKINRCKKKYTHCSTPSHVRLFRVYLKSILPVYQQEKTPSNGTQQCDMICSYFYEDKDRHKKRGRNANVHKKENMQRNKNMNRVKSKHRDNNMQMNRVKSKYRDDNMQINRVKSKHRDNNMHMNRGEKEDEHKMQQEEVTNYGEEMCQMLGEEREENLYYTHNQNLHILQDYKFVCKVCKKSEHVKIEEKQMFQLAYLRYLYNVHKYIPCNKKRRKKKKNGRPYCEINNHTSNSSHSDEFSYMNFFHGYKNNHSKEESDLVTNTSAARMEKVTESTSLFNFSSSNLTNNINSSGVKSHDLIFREKMDNKNYTFINENTRNYYHYRLTDWLIQCKTCRYLHKYDNLSNDYLLNFCKTNYFFHPLFFLNMSEKKILSYLSASQEREKNYLRENIKNKVEKRDDIKNVGNDNERVKYHFRSYSDMSTYRYGEMLQMWENVMKKYDTKGDTIYRPLMKMKEKRCSRKKKKWLDDLRRQNFEEYYIRIRGIREMQQNGYPLGESNEDGPSLNCMGNELDMHFFSICDGHGGSHASEFLIQNVHKVFHSLLIHTFFNIHLSLKMLHPLLDLLYYRECIRQNIRTYSGSCIINILLRGNYIYVNNTGDSKCALVTFHLDRFEYIQDTSGGGEATCGSEKDRRENNRLSKKGISKKGLSKKGLSKKGISKKGLSKKGLSKDHPSEKQMECKETKKEISRTDRDSNSEKDNSDSSNNCDHSSYVINLNSISYNELNCEHNCNNYMEYLRMYKLYFCENLRTQQMSIGERKHYCEKINEKENRVVSPISDDTFGDNDMAKEGEKKKKKKKKEKGKVQLDNHLNGQIIKLNNFLLNEKGKQINIGNLSYELIKFNRLDGCLHPSRVIGDYDLKRKYNKGTLILSNDSNVYKYDMNNINFFNSIHYIYSYKFCNMCKRNYLLSSYGKIAPISQIVLLDTPEGKFQRMCNKSEREKLGSLCLSKLCCSPILNDDQAHNKVRGKKYTELFFKIYRDDSSNSDLINNSTEKREKFPGNMMNERFPPYIKIKNVSLNNNYLCGKNRKNFFHLLIIASDGVFEYINPQVILNILKKNKSVHAKIQKIYKIYNSYNVYDLWTSIPGKKTQKDINKMMHKYMFTKEECTKLARDIVKNSIMCGNIDDSTCFCVFIFPTFFFFCLT